ncbi:MAG: hypothetical protein JWQ49_4414 [Edaphobacter sp.]|nr:hypothetical protein [Edaphobacter sp.]
MLRSRPPLPPVTPQKLPRPPPDRHQTGCPIFGASFAAKVGIRAKHEPRFPVRYSDSIQKHPKPAKLLRYNEALILRGIPPAAFDYRLGTRSALEGSSTHTAPPPTTAPASPTTPTPQEVKATTNATSSASSARSSPSPSKPRDHRHPPLPQLPHLTPHPTRSSFVCGLYNFLSLFWPKKRMSSLEMA